MKESFGAATNMYLFMFFFIIYVCFFAIALNFAKTYRIKNYVVDVLEQYQYDGGKIENYSFIKSKLDEYFDFVPYKGYNTYASNYCKDIGDNCEDYGGASVIALGSDDARYYRVVVFFKVEFPLLEVASFYIPISGETVIIN